MEEEKPMYVCFCFLDTFHQCMYRAYLMFCRGAVLVALPSPFDEIPHRFSSFIYCIDL